MLIHTSVAIRATGVSDRKDTESEHSTAAATTPARGGCIANRSLKADAYLAPHRIISQRPEQFNWVHNAL